MKLLQGQDETCFGKTPHAENNHKCLKSWMMDALAIELSDDQFSH